jgi:hypothetical protein
MKRAFPFLLLLSFAACGREEAVRRYRAPKDPQWRILGAVVPRGDATWFFKSWGSEERLAAHRDEFARFLAAVKFEEERPVWTLPEGWKEEKGNASRFATLRFGSLQPQFELSVTRLQDAAGGIGANVNRWRGQLGLRSLPDAEIERDARKVEVGGSAGILVDLMGPNHPGGPPMQSPHPEPAPARAPVDASLKGVRALFTYDVPRGWVENPEPTMGRILEFRAGSALVTFTMMKGESGGTVANVNRWREQAGMEALPESALRAELRSEAFLGRDGSLVELAGRERAILCFFHCGEEFSMFLKIDGSPDHVLSQREAFLQFGRTLKINRKHG